jgi:hypothetical protein
VCGDQPSPHKPRLVVSHSTCPPLSSSTHAHSLLHSFVLGTAVINTTQSLWRGVVIRSKCHSRALHGALSGWAQVTERTAVRVRVVHQLVRGKTHSLLRHVITAMRASIVDTKWRRVAATRKGDNLTAQGLRQILIGWSSMLPSNSVLQSHARSDEHRATVLASTFRRRTLLHAWLKWRAHCRYTQLLVQRVRIIWSRHYQIVAACVFCSWTGSWANTRLEKNVANSVCRRDRGQEPQT